MNMNKMNDLLMPRIESAAQMTLGQIFLRLIDRILWIIEKSVQWSLPSQDVGAAGKATAPAEENGGGKSSFAGNKLELVRPLPWIIFLPTLLFLRIIRVGLNAFGAILGYPRVEPSDVIRVIQKGRRRIRAIKSSGLKTMRQKNCTTARSSKDRALTMREASKNLAKSIRLTLSTLSCLDSASKTSPSPPPTKIRVSNILDSASPMTEEKSAIDSAIGSPSNQDGKRKYSELSGEDSSGDESDEEPLISKIDRLANMSSSSDKDFSIGDRSSAEASDTSSSESDADTSIPLKELDDIKNENQQWINQSYDTVKRNAQSAKTKNDNELHKLTECLAKLEKFNAQPYTKGSKTQELETTPEVMENDKHELLITNGVGNERDNAYYSPISWKSVSPEVSILADKQDNHVDIEEKPTEDHHDGQVNNGQEKENCNIDGKNSYQVSEEPVVESAKDKQQNSSQIGGSGTNKHHQKHKRGNHGNRKKK